MKTFTTFIATVVILLGLNSCKDFKTKNSENEFTFEPYKYEAISNVKGKNVSAFIAPENTPACTVIPTQTQVNNGQWTFSDRFYSASQAIKLGIPIVNMNASHDLKVYVKDYRRVSPCTASDNITKILYGQVVRTVIEIENYDASAGVDLASIAANGTLKKNTQHFYFYKDGFYNQKIDDILAGVQGKTFDVENYSLYQSVMSDIIKLLRETTTTFSVNRIGIEQQFNDNDELLTKSAIVAYALTGITNGNSSNKTKEKFKNNKDAFDVIHSVYNSLEVTLGDEKPTEEAKLKAKKYLQGIKVKN